MLPWAQPHVSPGQRDDQIRVFAEKMRALASSPESAYAACVEVERSTPASHEVGYRLYAVHQHVIVGARMVTLGDDRNANHLVIGRHTSCDFVMGDSATGSNDVSGVISLRHVIVRVSRLDDGLILLHVLDLDSGLGFELSDRSTQHAIVANGPIVFRIGAIWIVALPMNTPLPDTLEAPIVRHADAGSHVVGARGYVPAPISQDPSYARPKSDIHSIPGAYSPHSRSRRTSEISILPKSVRLSQTTGNQPLPGGGVRGTYAMVFSIPPDHGTIGGRQAGILLSEQDLDHGVLIGRDERCVDAGIRAIFDVGVSRVHALVIRERRGIVLYDIASMNGISDGMGRVRSMILADMGTTGYLMSRSRIMFRWRGLGQSS